MPETVDLEEPSAQRDVAPAKKGKNSKNLNEKEKKKLLKEANDRRKTGKTAVAHNIPDALESLQFKRGNQWSEKDVTARKIQNRTTLTVNLIHKYIAQIVGDMKKNKLSINIRPKPSAGNSDLASVFEGIIGGIEADSRAERIYEGGGESQISCGFGAWRVLNRYESWDSFNQECYLELVENPFTVTSDPDTRDPNGLDKMWCFVDSKMSKKEYEAMFPDSKITKDWIGNLGTGEQWEHWYDGESVAKTEYYFREKTEVKMALLSTGDTMELDDAEEEIDRHNKLRKKLIKEMQRAASRPQSPVAPQVLPNPAPQLPNSAIGANPSPPIPAGQPSSPIAPAGAAPVPSQPPAPLPGSQPVAPLTATPETMTGIPEEITIVKTRTAIRYKVKRAILTANEIIEEPVDIPGEYIPVVEIHGERVNIAGKRYQYGKIQFAKDPQRFVNYQLTTASEVTRMTPKAPYLVSVENIKGLESKWAAAGNENVPYLPFNPDSENPNGPRRETPVQLGDIMPQIALSAEFVRDSIGQFNIGKAPSRDQSGEALSMLEDSEDDSTFSYIDNLVAGVEATGIILLSQIPEVYDTERDVKVTLPTGQESFMPINTTISNAMTKMLNNPSKYAGLDKKKIRKAYKESPLSRFNHLDDGHFTVRVTVGPSYKKQQRDIVASLLKAGQYYPGIAAAGGDIVAQNLPLPAHLTEELSRRTRKQMAAGGLVAPDPEDPKPLPPNPQMVAQMKAVEAEGIKAQAALISATARKDSVKMQAAAKLTEIQSKEKIAGIQASHQDKELKQRAAELIAQLMHEREMALMQAAPTE